MKFGLALALLALSTPRVWPIGIVQILEDSAAARLAKLSPVDPGSPAYQLIRSSYERVLKQTKYTQPVDFRCVEGPVDAAAELGRILVARRGLEEIGEGPRLFILAHELGHIVLGHWSTRRALYLAHFPGEITETNANPSDETFGREAHVLAFEQEFAADAFGYRIIKALGFGLDSALAALQLNASSDLTHPPMGRRYMQLMEIENTEFPSPPAANRL
jgi:Zn-dependent protease with chaperone function